MSLHSRVPHLPLFALLCALVAAPAYARSDASFLKQAAENGAAEVEASRLAESKAKSPEVKSYAEAMVSDHEKVAAELQQLAQSKNVKLPTEPSLTQKAKLKMIDAGDDAKFDARYTESFGVKAHEDTIKLFSDAARDSKDADVKAFAQKTLPSLQHHLEMARALPTATAQK